MKKILTVIAAIFLSTTMLLVGCGPKGLKDNPKTADPVYSNGGMAVLKGDYVYFVNGFKSYNDLTKDVDNVWGKQVLSAIYRTKVSDLNEISHDDDGFLSKAEVVVPQMVGTENSNFYIFGDYIYYATPNMQKDKNGNLLNARSNLCRVKINGTDNKVLYTTEATLTQANWSMYELDGTVYMLVYDNSKIISINASANKAPVILNKKATSTAFISNDNYIKSNTEANKTINGVNNYIYYTRDITKDDADYGKAGNILARININGGAEEIVCADGENSYAINTAKNGCIYYTKTNVATTVAKFCKYVLSEQKNKVENNESEISYVTYSKTFVLNSNNENYIGTDVVTIDEDNNIMLVKNVNGVVETTYIYKASSKITPINVYGDKLFYLEDSKIYYINVRNGANQTPLKVETNDKTLKTDITTFFDYDGRNAYYYLSYEAEDGSTNYYLNRTDLNANTSESEFVGVFDKDHTPKKPDEDSDEKWIK